MTAFFIVLSLLPLALLGTVALRRYSPRPPVEPTGHEMLLEASTWRYVNGWATLDEHEREVERVLRAESRAEVPDWLVRELTVAYEGMALDGELR